MSFAKFVAVLTVALCTLTTNAHAGKIVVSNDEFSLSNAGFDAPNDPAQFSQNIANWFTGGGPGNFLAYTSPSPLAYNNNFGLTGSMLANAMTTAGNAWTVSIAPVDLATLLSYDGLFLAGDPLDNALLISYVNAGGNVYLVGGTGWGGPVDEAARWNTFLNAFGLAFSSSYNDVIANIEISDPHPIFAGVDHLLQVVGNDVIDTLPGDSHGQVLVSSNGHGLYAVYDSNDASVPEPGALLLVSTAFVLLTLRKRV